ncbi:hypothetical protein UFOVP115_83 [uncultured Caudovirales phage]|uniref:Uncharacterized protein n=1 Tax=uncultured Caudovirales phage TaxID=2100421 RepID=A0A6J5L6J6_9CAUD|nr:hypothetical protein UFOVP115_83 [uncultured Caudovirales phage]
MYIEMSCKCGALLNFDGFNESFTHLTTARFLEAHVSCGFVTPVTNDGKERTIRREFDIKKIVRLDEDEE